MAGSSRERQIDYEQLDLEAERRRKRPRGDHEAHHSLAIRNGHQKRLRYQDYKIGVICALEFEMSAIRYMLDEEHLRLPPAPGDRNLYVLGNLCGHNVAIACLPGNQGKGAAATVATNMARTFLEIDLRVLVGIGGGIPSDRHDIRLGDVVIGMPDGLHSGVIQYDLGKDTEEGFVLKGYLEPVPSILRSAIVRMQSDHRVKQNKINEFLGAMLKKGEGLSTYQKPPADTDVLFQVGSKHILSQERCKYCDSETVIHRDPRKSNAPKIHYGLIASGDRVMRNARGSRLTTQPDLCNVLCFEMEAAGILTDFPCLVIRGISDYADSHKNDDWQHYAAAVAAGCAKEVLSYLSSELSVDEMELDYIISQNYAAPASAKPADISSRHRDGDNESLSKEAKQKLLESLRFDQIEARKSNIKSSHARTCKWLLENPEYCEWLDTTELNSHHGVLWIKGKPGAGKSTLMKFALDNAIENMKDRTVLHFFFNARGEELEKSTIGMYRSLLWQLFSEHEAPAMKARHQDKGFQWNVVLLQEVFQKAIQSLGESAIMCFIDALDECEEMQIRDMLRFFEDMAGLAVKAGIRFNVLFASRHYPHITIKKGLELTLEGQKGHSDDIVAYVDSELKIGDSNLATQIQIKDELRRKASGVFMWVVLVVQILNKEHDRGRIHDLEQKLRHIPGDLHELFRDILARDDANRDELILCIQWVLFAIRPLKPVELYCILLFETDCSATNEWKPGNITDEAMKRYILDCSKGLSEITVSNPTVQFIHESVRDFLLKENWLSQIWPELGDNFQGQSHEHLKRLCLEYMTMKSIPGCLGLENSHPKAHRREMVEGYQPCGKATDAFPFLEYSVLNIFEHAEAAAKNGIIQSAFLEDFQLSYWNALNGILGNVSAYKYDSVVSLQYFLAEYGLLNLIEACPFSPSWLEEENYKERDEHALFWCLTTKSKDTLQAIMRAYARNGPPGSKLHGLCNRAVSANIQDNFELSKRNSVPPVAPGTGEELLFIFMLETGAILLDDFDEEWRTPLEYAAANGYLQLARLSLDRERADPNFDSDSSLIDLALLYAASNGHEEIVKLLLADPHVDPNLYNFNTPTALANAASNGNEKIVKLLLADPRVDPNLYKSNTPTALANAAEHGQEKIVKLLLTDPRVDPNLYDPDILTVLACAAADGQEEIVKLLLANPRVDPNLHGSYKSTALASAALNGHEEIVKLLLADPRVAIQSDVTPLVCAVRSGHIELVRFLLDDQRCNLDIKNDKRGALISSAARRCYPEIVKLLFDNQHIIRAIEADPYESPLSSAVVNGHAEIVKLLLDKQRFHPDMKDDEGWTPLCHAAAYNHAEIVTLLLTDQCADPNLTDIDGRTPLSWAAGNGHTETVKLLLAAKNIDLNTKSADTLSWAARNGHTEVVELLLGNEHVKSGIWDDEEKLVREAWSYGMDITKLLLAETPIDPNILTPHGMTLLSWAAWNDDRELAELLLKSQRLKPNIQDKEGRSALLLATERRNVETLQLLLSDPRVDLTIQDKDGKTALSLAREMVDETLVSMLQSACR
ncbi:Pfs, NB-ARC and Ankyrin domain protein [Aspergillus puulaauensis]|uniref:Nucleoside phosphorylase domain-containing protein n=1 Tax=Aspergillus puulaauensis TaxID=1220207 RepID=A0A7R7XSA6_9EURO|nr:uncharacterized protein APUU_50644S [Aspergillus puulaauensis]BCS25933.1 hypothetical protein APUU_50644S [Aspergillus puulaauensis]